MDETWYFGRFRLEVWESNKGPVLGLCRWRLSYWIPDLETWYPLRGIANRWPVAPDRAMRDAEHALCDALAGYIKLPED